MIQDAIVEYVLNLFFGHVFGLATTFPRMCVNIGRHALHLAWCFVEPFAWLVMDIYNGVAFYKICDALAGIHHGTLAYMHHRVPSGRRYRSPLEKEFRRAFKQNPFMMIIGLIITALAAATALSSLPIFYD